jgi:excisionase family DNA binding protein
MDTQSTATTQDPLMTEKETANYLRIKLRQLYNWRVNGLIPYIRIGRALRYRKSAVDHALDQMTLGPR